MMIKEEIHSVPDESTCSKCRPRREEISACAIVNTQYIMGTCHCVQSVILLPCMKGDIDGWLHHNKIISFKMKVHCSLNMSI